MAAAERLSDRGADASDAGEPPGSNPWCIDHGDGMTVMSTAELRAALDRGELPTDHKAWRDGWPCWLVLAEVGELRESWPRARAAADGEVEESGMRRVERAVDLRLELDDELDVPLSRMSPAMVGFLAFVAASGCLVLVLAAAVGG